MRILSVCVLLASAIYAESEAKFQSALRAREWRTAFDIAKALPTKVRVSALHSLIEVRLSNDVSRSSCADAVAYSQSIAEVRGRVPDLVAETCVNWPGLFSKASRTELRVAIEKCAETPRRAYWLGMFHQSGISVPRSYRQARAHFERAGREGDSDSRHHLALLKGMGLGGFDEDPKSAVESLQTLARAGHPLSMWRVGQAHITGLGVDENHATAAKWLGRAVEAGIDLARWDLYSLSLANKSDGSESLRLLEQAALHRCAQAQVELGRRLHAGTGYARCRSLGYVWSRLGFVDFQLQYPDREGEYEKQLRTIHDGLSAEEKKAAAGLYSLSVRELAAKARRLRKE